VKKGREEEACLADEEQAMRKKWSVFSLRDGMSD